MFCRIAHGQSVTGRWPAVITMVCLTAMLLAWNLSRLVVSVAAQPGQGAGSAATMPGTAWRFAVAGDSRNCGDVVMPVIAAGAKARGAAFFWHLGDFRAMLAGRIDEDFADQPSKPASDADYYQTGWNDFIKNQLLPFGETPVFLAIGNHELYHHTRADYLARYREWLTAPDIGRQRLADDPSDTAPRTYYHWVKDGIDFITLDNASGEQFDAAQMRWFEKVLAADQSNPEIRTIVAGMHKPLPDSISYGHSMNESPDGVSIQSGRQVYQDLWKAQNDFHKRVYILASHSHYYMEGTFNTDFWKGRVLPGWIVGTAGAERYQLPSEWRRANRAMQGVYGYLLATVNPDVGDGHPAGGTIRFEFQLINKSDLSGEVRQKFRSSLIDFCFDQNMRKPE